MNFNTLKNIYIGISIVAPVGLVCFIRHNYAKIVENRSYGLIIENKNNDKTINLEKCTKAILSTDLFRTINNTDTNMLDTRMITEDNIRTYDKDIFNISTNCDIVYMGESIIRVRDGHGLSINKNGMYVGEYFLDMAHGSSLMRKIDVNESKLKRELERIEPYDYSKFNINNVLNKNKSFTIKGTSFMDILDKSSTVECDNKNINLSLK